MEFCALESIIAKESIGGRHEPRDPDSQSIPLLTEILDQFHGLLGIHDIVISGANAGVHTCGSKRRR
jgi:hypothetical protein